MLSLCLSGCAVIPEYTQPNIPVSVNDRFYTDNASQTDRSDGLPQMSQWWLQYDDPTLHQMITDLRKQNLTLKAMRERVNQAYEQWIKTSGSAKPSLSGEWNASRTLRPGQNIGSSFSFNQNRQYNNSFESLIRAAWQVDLFQKIRYSQDASNAAYQASIAEQEALEHTLIAQLIRYRIHLSNTQARLNIQEQIVKSRNKTLNIIQKRYKAGSSGVSAFDIHISRENLATAESRLPAIQKDLKLIQHQLAILLGLKAKDFFARYVDVKSLAALPPPLDQPLVLPIALIERRPDLRQAEWRIRQAYANVGVSVANLYPDLNLSAQIGFTSDSASQWWDADQLAGNILSRLTQSFYQGGALKADVRLNEARLKELSYDYSQKIITAIHDVETSLLEEKFIRAELASLDQSLTEIRQAEQLAMERFQRGTGSLLELLDTQRRRQQTEINLITAQRSKWDARIDLYLALGGDWSQ